jgi:hypothetical protein
MTNPISPRKIGVAMCRKRSPVLSDDRATKKETTAAKSHGGAASKNVTVVENPSVAVRATTKPRLARMKSITPASRNSHSGRSFEGWTVQQS